MAIDPNKMVEMDKVSGLSPEKMSAMDNAVGQSSSPPGTPTPQGTGSKILDLVGSLIGKTSSKVARLSGYGAAQLSGAQGSLDQERGDASKQMSLILARINNEKDPKKKALLQNEADRYMKASQSNLTDSSFFGENADVQQYQDKIANGGNQYTMGAQLVGGGMLEQAANLATMPGDPLGTGAKGFAGLAQTAGNAALTSGVRAGISSAGGSMGDYKTANEVESDAVKGAAIGTVMDLGIKGALKAGKVGLKAISSFIPQNPDVDTFKGIFTIPSKLYDKLNVDKSSKKLVDYGFAGNLEEMSLKGKNASTKLLDARDLIIDSFDGPVKLDGVQDAAQEVLTNRGISGLDKKQEKIVMATIRNFTDGSQEKFGETSAAKAFKASKALDDIGFEKLQGSVDATGTVVDKVAHAEGQAYLAASDYLKQQIDNISGGKEVIKEVMTPEYLSQLSEISPKLAEDASKVKSLSELRSLIAPFVDLDKMIKSTKRYSNTQGTKLLQKIPMIGGALDAAVNTAPVRSNLAQGLNAVRPFAEQTAQAGGMVSGAAQAAGNALPSSVMNYLKNASRNAAVQQMNP